jgi:hypothetical protein
MRTLNEQEKRTVRLGAMVLAMAFVVFFGMRAWKFVEGGRRDYLQLVEKAKKRKQELLPYSDKADKAKQWMESFKFDPAKLTRATVVAEASAAIQKAAAGSGIQVGPIRETPTRGSAREVAQMQFEGTGKVDAALGLLGQLESIGFPLVVEAVQINSEPTKPGMIKMTLTILILDFEQWKKAEAPRA